MSAFQLNDDVLEKMAAHILWGELHGVEQRYRGPFQELARLLRAYGIKDDMGEGNVSWGLHKFNAVSVSARYKEESETMELPLKVDNALSIAPNWLWFYDNLNCWIYQSCEGEQNTNAIYELASDLKNFLAGYLLGKYRPREVKWGLV